MFDFSVSCNAKRKYSILVLCQQFPVKTKTCYQYSHICMMWLRVISELGIEKFVMVEYYINSIKQKGML